MTIKKYDAINKISSNEKEQVVSFLYQHLEQYGDSKSAIGKAVDYAAKDRSGFGGYVFAMMDGDQIIGAVVINKTGMDEYIPENILVYIANHKDYRGRGLGKQLMRFVIDNCEGDIALHVEKDNPAKYLYEKLGFSNPYLEMRLQRDAVK